MNTTADFNAADEEARLGQNPVSRRRIARDIAEMANEPYPNTRLIPNQDSIVEACLLLYTGTRVVHVSLQFDADYPDTPARTIINGRAGVSQRPDSVIPCADVLADLDEGMQAYTIKTLAIHLLSMFDGDNELFRRPERGELWLPSDRTEENFLCYECGHPWIKYDVAHQGAEEASRPSPTFASGPNPSRTIRDLPVELLKQVLGHLTEVEDLVRFGQAWDRIEDIIEEDVVIRDLELKCFVTKEHFSKSPLGIGIYLPSWPRSAASAVDSEFDFISLDAFGKLGVCTTAYGCEIEDWLPLPLSRQHWDQINTRAYQSLHHLAWRRPVSGSIMDVLVSFMKDQVTKLFTSEEKSPATGLLQPSMKAVESLFFLFHLLVCVAVDRPKYVRKTNEMVKKFQADNSCTKDLPSGGLMLAALLISDVETNDNFLPKLFFEAVTRNVPELLRKHPELGWLEPDGAASAYRLHHTFMATVASYRAIMFMNLFQRTVRPTNTGTSLKDTRDWLFHRRGFPPSATLATLVAELPRIMAIDSFPGFLDYLGIYPDANERSIADKLRDAVRECVSTRALASWPLSHGQGAVLRRAAEASSPLAWTEGLPRYPNLSRGW